MNISVSFAVLVIGFAAGLRTFTAPAVTAWSAYLGLIDLTSTPLAFVSSPVAVTVFSLFALAEYVYDILPRTPPRTATLGLIARFVFGSFSAACLLAALGEKLAFCILGGIAAIGGAFAGYQVRARVGKSLGIKDAFVGISEDIVAIVIALAAVGLTG